MKLGVVGEDPNDSKSIINLLTNYFKENQHQFVVLVHEITGDQLGTKKGRNLIKIEYINQSPDYVLYSRDLDDLGTNTGKIKERNKEFDETQKVINGMGILLLNIFELETLIIGDILSFNKHYGSGLSVYTKPMDVMNPKEELKTKTNHLSKPYHESANPEIFAIIDPNVIRENCSYFRDFLAKLKVRGIN